MKIISGSSNKDLAQEIADYLNTKLTRVTINKFADKEIYVKINESVRGEDIFVIQSLCNPVNDNLMELLLLVDALKRASANKITAVIPYYGYARQDRKIEPREPISAKLVADLLTISGVDRIVVIDLHAVQIQGFFNIPLDNLWAVSILANYIKELKLNEIIVVSPDLGGGIRARRLGKILDAPIALIDKKREAHNISSVMNVIGDVNNKNVVIVDDIIDTGISVIKATKSLLEKGAKSVSIAATHGVFSNNAINLLNESIIKNILITNTIPQKSLGKIKVLSISPLLGEAIRRINENLSVSEM